MVRSKQRNSDVLSAYFSLGTVMQGLSRLFERLYGIRLVPHETAPGETWNDDVRRLDVIDENEGHIAVVYCDLFERPDKNPNPAHFTLRCSRHITASEIADHISQGHPLSSINDGMASSTTPSGSLYQLPTIVLICDFSVPSPSNATRPVLLSFKETETLFHEMGHALHSILGRTALQNVSGTRCATDFAELPSILMEHFATAPEVLALFARHWETGEQLPYRMVREHVEQVRLLEGSETEAQILLAMLDQEYHSALPLSWSQSQGGGFESSKIYHELAERHCVLPDPKQTSWQGFYGHLFGYGATYY
jgi:intermediate peptidase